MKQTEIDAFNAGLAALADVARRSADVMRSKLKQKPTRYGFAIEALDGIVEAAKDLRLRDNPADVPGSSTTRPLSGGGGAGLLLLEDAR